MPDQNSHHSRRPHYHRGRRGPDRRGGERRPSQPPPDSATKDHLDVEQLMREIRSRVSERHGIELTNQQVQDLAARRLEAILDPRGLKPSLMDELRRAAGVPADSAPAEPEATYSFEASTLYDSPNGFLRFIRRALAPLLKLFFNPDALADALGAQARLNRAAAGREAEERRRQAEWNALHFEILRRLVTDVARADIDTQNLALRVESLAARVDFNERRVRGLEQTQHQAKPTGRPADAPPPSVAAPRDRDEAIPSSNLAPAESTADAGRRRRRRRRGRRPGGGGQLRDNAGAPASEPVEGAPLDAVDSTGEGDDFEDDLAADGPAGGDAGQAGSIDLPADELETAAPMLVPDEPFRAAPVVSDTPAATADSTSGSDERPEPAPEKQ